MADTELEVPARARARHVPAADLDAARIGPAKAGERVDELRLAVAVDPRDRDDLAGAHLERDAPHLLQPAVVADAQNIGFAVPVNLAKSILPALLSEGRVIRPWVGFHGQLVGGDLKELLKAPLVDGLLVEVIEPGSPAATAGLHGGQLELEAEQVEAEEIAGPDPAAEPGGELTAEQRELLFARVFELLEEEQRLYLDRNGLVPSRP